MEKSFFQQLKSTRSSELKALVQRFIASSCKDETYTQTAQAVLHEHARKRYQAIFDNSRSRNAASAFEGRDEWETMKKMIVVSGLFAKYSSFPFIVSSSADRFMTQICLPLLDIQPNASSPSFLNDTDTKEMKSDVIRCCTHFLQSIESKMEPHCPKLIDRCLAFFVDSYPPLVRECSSFLQVLFQISSPSSFLLPRISDLLKSTIPLVTTLPELADRIELIELIAQSMQIYTSSSKTKVPVSSDLIPLLRSLLDTLCLMLFDDHLATTSSLSLAILCTFSSLVPSPDIHQQFLAKSFDSILPFLEMMEITSKHQRKRSLVLIEAIEQIVSGSSKREVNVHLERIYRLLIDRLRSVKLQAKQSKQKIIRGYYHKLRTTIIKAMSSILGQFDDFSPFADDFISHAARVLADPLILADFVAAMVRSSNPDAKEILRSKYLDSVLRPLLNQLKKEDALTTVKISIVKTLGKVAASCGELFSPYFIESFDSLQSLLDPSIALSFGTCAIDSCFALVKWDLNGQLSLDERMSSFLRSITTLLRGEFDQTVAADHAFDESDSDSEEQEEADVVTKFMFRMVESLKDSIDAVSSDKPFISWLCQHVQEQVGKEPIFEDDRYLRLAELDLAKELVSRFKSDIDTTKMLASLKSSLENSIEEEDDERAQLTREVIHQLQAIIH